VWCVCVCGVCVWYVCVCGVFVCVWCVCMCVCVVCLCVWGVCVCVCGVFVWCVWCVCVVCVCVCVRARARVHVIGKPQKWGGLLRHGTQNRRCGKNCYKARQYTHKSKSASIGIRGQLQCVIRQY